MLKFFFRFSPVRLEGKHTLNGFLFWGIKKARKMQNSIPSPGLFVLKWILNKHSVSLRCAGSDGPGIKVTRSTFGGFVCWLAFTTYHRVCVSFSECNERTLKLFSPILLRDNFSDLCVPAQSIKVRDIPTRGIPVITVVRIPQ